MEQAGVLSHYFPVYLASIILAVISNIVLSVVLIIKRRHSFAVNAFICFLMSVVLWGVAVVIMNTVQLTTEMYEMMNNVASLGYVTMPVWLFLFSYAYVGREKNLLHYRVFSMILTSVVLFLYLSWTTPYVKGQTLDTMYMTAWGTQTSFGFVYPIFLVWLEVLFLLSLYRIYKDYASALDVLRKVQSKYIMSAILIPLSIGTITDGLMPLLDLQVFPAAIPMTSFMSLLIGYAILKYGLFELSFENILTSMKIPMITVGMNNEVLLMNETARTLLKESKNYPGKQIDDILKQKETDRHYPSVTEMMKRVFIQGKPTKVKAMTLLKTTGEKTIVSLHALPITADNQVHAANILLYPESAQDKSLFGKNEIISIASHEIKTPLTSIKLIADLLQRAAAERKDVLSYEYLAKMNAQLDTMSALIHDFMDVANIEKGKLSLNKEELHLYDTVTGVVEIMQNLAGKRLISVDVGKDLVIHADKVRMTQVLMNLLSNAIKYSPDATTISIRAMNYQEGVCIEVEDQGIGIAKAKQSSIFRSFYRVKKDVGSISGIGMGLYIAKKIIETHKGKISLRSKSGKGTIFRIYLP